MWPRSRHIISPEAHPVLERLGWERIWRAEQMNVIGHDHVAPNPPEIRRRHAVMISLAASEFASKGLRRWVHTVRKMMIDRNPTSTVGKCAGFFRSGLHATFGGVAELRPPFESAFTARASDLSLVPLPTCECVCR